jgi:hypothetical protein
MESGENVYHALSGVASFFGTQPIVPVMDVVISVVALLICQNALKALADTPAHALA